MSCHCNHVWHLYDLGILAPDLHVPTYCFLWGLGRWPMDMASFGGKDFAGLIKNEIILDFLSDPWIWKTPFKEAEEETDTEVLMKTRQRLEWCGHKSRDSSSYQKLKKKPKPCFLLDFGHLGSRTTRNEWVTSWVLSPPTQSDLCHSSPRAFSR